MKRNNLTSEKKKAGSYAAKMKAGHKPIKHTSYPIYQGDSSFGGISNAKTTNNI